MDWIMSIINLEESNRILRHFPSLSSSILEISTVSHMLSEEEDLDDCFSRL